MKALIVDDKCQLGRALTAIAPAGVKLVSHDVDTHDITDRAAIVTMVANVGLYLILNAAAHTAVDNAESNKALALAVNATAVGYLADVAQGADLPLVHASTDFVFDVLFGMPYRPDATPNPFSAHGRTRLAGELAAGLRSWLCVRPSSMR